MSNSWNIYSIITQSKLSYNGMYYKMLYVGWKFKNIDFITHKYIVVLYKKINIMVMV